MTETPSAFGSDDWLHDLQANFDGGHLFNARGVEIGRGHTDIEAAAQMFFGVRGGTR